MLVTLMLVNKIQTGLLEGGVTAMNAHLFQKTSLTWILLPV